MRLIDEDLMRCSSSKRAEGWRKSRCKTEATRIYMGDEGGGIDYGGTGRGRTYVEPYLRVFRWV